MPAVPAYIPYGRFFLRLRHPKLILISLILIILMSSILLLLAYQESWLDPFNTLSVPNNKLHPLSFSQIGLMDPNDPFNPHFFADRQKVKELMRNLQHATPTASDQTQVLANDEKILYFTLHREANYFHEKADLALQYYPQRNIVCFARQQYKIDHDTVQCLNDITQKMQAGWWNTK
ncbi:MAG TPA: hypothetical protein VN370_08925 [Desulfitobacteriaceae bacterium]|jgi:hypothetical protein|nr:hypothetical protein [Desulfitobacteriaceae bacterium]